MGSCNSMISLLATSFLAQPDGKWIEVAVIVVIVALSALSSAGRWIVKQIELNKEKEARRRQGQLNPQQPALPPGRPVTKGIPPFAAPAPPIAPRRQTREAPPTPPVMERVLEVLLERTTGTPLERRIREAVEKKVAPPPPPARKTPKERSAERQSVRQTQQRKEDRPVTVAERAALRDRARQTAVEQEEQAMIRREQKLTEDTDQRLGRVETHIGGTEVRDTSPADPYDLYAMLDNPESLRRAILLSEILGPPVSLRSGLYSG